MARPRKDARLPDARLRIIEALWTLLEANRLQEITVSMIAAEAGCNRGTFYYHYTDIHSLVTQAIESELMHDNVIPNYVFDTISNIDESSWSIMPAFCEKRMNRLQLIIDKGGMDLLADEIKSTVSNMWKTVIRPVSGELSAETRFILEYVSGGLLGVIARMNYGEEDIDASSLFVKRFQKENATMVVRYISAAEGVPFDEILARLKAITEFMHVIS